MKVISFLEVRMPEFNDTMAAEMIDVMAFLQSHYKTIQIDCAHQLFQ